MVAEDVLHYLYVSRLDARHGPACVAAIFDVSRRRNRPAGLRGALLFDGERFAQLLVGDAQVLAALLEDIRGDDRHAGFRALFDGTDDAAAAAAVGLETVHSGLLAGEWRAGYAPPDALEALDEPLAPAAALAAFLGLLPHCDLD